jgi:predicted kinase
MLIVLAGLPGSGKSTLARTLAREIGALWLRVDSIEQAIRASGVAEALDDAGYRVGYSIAEDNLRLGLTIIADSVNPWMLTRNAWRDAGLRAGARVVEIEIVCSDAQEHRRRVEARPSEIPGLILPDWEKTIRRDYRPWDRERIVIDSAGRSVGECVTLVRSFL